MTSARRQAVFGASLVLLLLTTGAWVLVHRGADGSVARSASDLGSVHLGRPPGTDPSGARTALPGLVPPSGEPLLAGLGTTRPAPGSVERLVGPFDDRIAWSRLRWRGTGVSGTVTVTSDVSDLLELQVLAGFYDRDGRLLGARRFVRHAAVHDEAVGSLPAEAQEFAVRVPPRWRGTAVSAAVGVPVLVNE